MADCLKVAKVDELLRGRHGGSEAAARRLALFKDTCTHKGGPLFVCTHDRRWHARGTARSSTSEPARCSGFAGAKASSVTTFG